MNRSEVLAIVKEKALTVLKDVQAERFDPQLSLKDLGADSLDLVKIVSMTIKQLGVRVPLSEFGNIKNIDGLVDFLHVKVSAPG